MRDRLDRFAVAVAGGSPSKSVAVFEGTDEPRLSRAQAVRLAVGGAATLWLGFAGRAAARPLETISGCVSGCATAHEQALARDYAECEKAIYGANGDFSTWVSRFGRAWIYGPEAMRLAWFDGCELAAQAARAVQQVACRDHCLDRCLKSPQDCAPTTPPKSQAAVAPPAPNPAEPAAGCHNCTSGVCCPCGSASGFSCADYIPHGPGATQNCDVCKRNCVGEC